MARHLRQEKEDHGEAVDETTVKYRGYDPPHSSNYLCFNGRHSGSFRGFLEMNDNVNHCNCNRSYTPLLQLQTYETATESS